MPVLSEAGALGDFSVWSVTGMPVGVWGDGSVRGIRQFNLGGGVYITRAQMQTHVF